MCFLISGPLCRRDVIVLKNLTKMATSKEPCQKEYREIILNGKTSNPPDDEVTIVNKPHTTYVTSLEDDEEVNEEWPYTCEEKSIPRTSHSLSLHDKYVSKRILTPGSAGKKPHFLSSCTFTVEEVLLLDSAFDDAFKNTVYLGKHNPNTEVELKLGSSSTELERALEYALFDMFVGERSEIVLHASQRSGKRKDEDVLTVPCLKCVIELRQVDNTCVSSNTLASKNYLHTLSSASEEEKYCNALNDKTVGIELFKQLRYIDAFHRFASGAKLLLTSDSLLLEAAESQNKGIVSLFSVLCSNMAECQLKENNPTRAIALCQKALDNNPCNVKAMYRQASAFWAVGNVDQADLLLCRVLELEPNNSAAKRLKSEVQVKIKSYEEEYAKMMRRIFR